MKTLLTIALLLLQVLCYSQKREELFDYNFQPDKGHGAYYYVVTEKKDSGWQRKAWFISQKSQYMEGWYSDDSCKIKHGEFHFFHPNKNLSEIGRYVNNKKEGPWLKFDEEGRLNDSSNYINGKRTGIGLSFYSSGFLSDSINLDKDGNGVEVRWYNDGTLSAAGYRRNDTLKRGRWKYYHHNGTVMATEDYDADGKLLVCNCYDSSGIQLDTSACREREARVDKMKWRRHLETSLAPVIEKFANKGMNGRFTIAVRFIVNKDGTVEELKALTAYGKGIEDEIIKVIQNGPLWEPAMLYGQKVKSYHTQPITMEIQGF